MDQDDFKPYDSDGDPSEVRAAITKDGVVILLKSVAQFIHPDEEFVDFSFSKKGPTLALKFSDTKSKHSYSLTKVGPSNFKIAMVKVLGFFSIDYSSTRVYVSRFDVERRTLFINLGFPVREED